MIVLSDTSCVFYVKETVRFLQESNASKSKLDQEKKTHTLVRNAANTQKKEGTYKEITKAVKGPDLHSVHILALLPTTTLNLSYQYLGGHAVKLPNGRNETFIAWLSCRQEKLYIGTTCNLVLTKLGNAKEIGNLEVCLEDVAQIAKIDAYVLGVDDCIIDEDAIVSFYDFKIGV